MIKNGTPTANGQGNPSLNVQAISTGLPISKNLINIEKFTKLIFFYFKKIEALQLRIIAPMAWIVAVHQMDTLVVFVIHQLQMHQLRQLAKHHTDP